MTIYRMWGYPIFRETKLYTQFASCRFFWCKKTYSASKKRAPAHGIFVPRQEEVLNVCSTIQRDNIFFLYTCMIMYDSLLKRFTNYRHAHKITDPSQVPSRDHPWCLHMENSLFHQSISITQHLQCLSIYQESPAHI